MEKANKKGKTATQTVANTDKDAGKSTDRKPRSVSKAEEGKKGAAGSKNKSAARQSSSSVAGKKGRPAAGSKSKPAVAKSGKSKDRKSSVSSKGGKKRDSSAEAGKGKSKFTFSSIPLIKIIMASQVPPCSTDNHFFHSKNSHFLFHLFTESAKKVETAEEKAAKPTRALSSYIFFSNEMVPKVKAEEGVQHKDAMKRCGEIWATYGDEEKKKY
jgi:hypothetical protein